MHEVKNNLAGALQRLRRKGLSLSAVILLLALTACGGTLGPGDRPDDPCFEGHYRWCSVEVCRRELRFLVNHSSYRREHAIAESGWWSSTGQISVSGYWFESSGTAPWEALHFTGSVWEMGRAEGTLVVDFGIGGDGMPVTYEIPNQSLFLWDDRGSLEDPCSEERALRLNFRYPDLTEPACEDPSHPDCHWITEDLSAGVVIPPW